MPPPKNTVYKTFILAGDRFTLGDNICVKNSEKGSKGDFISKIEKIYTDKNSEVQLDVRWYYRPEETVMGRMPWHARLEILESDHTDSIHVGSVNSKCEIYNLEEYEALPALGTKKVKVAGENSKVVLPEWICRSFYMHKKGKLRDPLPVYCKCLTPQNPEKTLIYCEKGSCRIAGRWVHGQCIGAKGVNTDDLQKAGKFYCPDCDGNSYFNCKAPEQRGKKRKA